jgi:hypothetical protein
MKEWLGMATKITKHYSVDRNDSVALGDLSGMPSAADLRGIPSAASSACLGIRTGRVGGRPVIPEFSVCVCFGTDEMKLMKSGEH